MRQIDEELRRAKELKLSDPREFRQMFADILTMEGKVGQFAIIFFSDSSFKVHGFIFKTI